MCDCRLCKQRRIINSTIKNGSHRQKNRLIRELADLYWHTDAELEVEEMIKSGDWPTAVEVLESRLKIAKLKREK